ncbi:UBX domain-containing protein 1-A [Biomphalaria pfeifferi]|uniref:UBX domain-containing protein 1-A n=1 Tax=Biomphalaria pfeifferi TaxID=112525 RepID=A0AAD8BRT2_BIOPF|nr:UBX domain-containing protein 1-A [Biomphalaria pfeifferi]
MKQKIAELKDIAASIFDDEAERKEYVRAQLEALKRKEDEKEEKRKEKEDEKEERRLAMERERSETETALKEKEAEIAFAKERRNGASGYPNASEAKPTKCTPNFPPASERTTQPTNRRYSSSSS